MKSNQMIEVLAADQASSPGPGRSMASAVVVGSIGAVILFALVLGVRPDVAAAIQRGSFLFKFVVTLSVAVPTLACLAMALQPGRQTRSWLLATGPVVLAPGVLIELSTTPAEGWSALMMGSNALLCLVSIPALAAAPFVCLFYAVRGGAPTRPRLAGALCGLAAGAIGATLYAAHCTDDSPLFVAVWYSMAIGLATVAGNVIGARWLRW